MAARSLVLVDGSALAYRSFFAFIRNPLLTSRGENTSAAFGFANSLLRILRDLDPTYLAVAFDTSAPTFRHDMYAEYKSTRAKMPDELAASLPRIDQLVTAMNVPTIREDGIEADDVIGSLAVWAAAKGIDVAIYSGDKDFSQLVNDRIHLIRPKPGEGDVRLDAGGVEKWMGVRPEQVIDLLSLMGDASDHVPGVPGVGPKTAVRLLEEHGSLDAILENVEAITGKLGERIRENREQALLSRKLVTIRTDVTLPVELELLKPKAPDREAMAALFRELEFAKLAEQFQVDVSETKTRYRRVRTMKELETLVARLRRVDCLAFDTETTSTNALDATLVGFSFCAEPGDAAYVPVGHAALSDGGEVNLPMDEALACVKPLLEDPDVPKALQHAKYDASVLLNHGIAIRGVDFDTLLAAYLLEPGRGRYSLSELSAQDLNHAMRAYKDLVGTGKNKREIWQVHADEVTDYACEDADVTLRLKNLYAPRLKESALEDLFTNVEMPLSDVLLHMERHGVMLDRSLFTNMSKALHRQIHALEKDIHALAGHPFNVSSTPQLRTVLYEELGLKAGRKTKTGASTDSDVLERLTDEHPIAGKILEFRHASKLLSTYVDALPKLVRSDTGRLHTSFNQTVAATGRLSSSDPNLQNIPIRTEAGRRIREGFVAPEGCVLVSADYNQVELRILASITMDSGLQSAFREGIDVHRHTAAAVFDVPLEAVTPDMRARAKAVNFGVMYGQGARGLAQQLGIPAKEATAFIEAYFERYSAVKLFKEETIQRARQDGYVSTLMGRRRYVPDIRSEHGQRRAYAERTAVNTVIQGTAADLIKVAMVAIARRLETEKLESAMILQVHDELVFESPVGERDTLMALVREEMQGALELDVPIVADTGAGANWLEAH